MLPAFARALQICQRFLDGPHPRAKELDARACASLQLIESVEGATSNRPGAGHNRSPELLPRKPDRVVSGPPLSWIPRPRPMWSPAFPVVGRDFQPWLSLRTSCPVGARCPCFQQVSPDVLISPVVDRLALRSIPELHQAPLEEGGGCRSYASNKRRSSSSPAQGRRPCQPGTACTRPSSREKPRAMTSRRPDGSSTRADQRTCLRWGGTCWHFVAGPASLQEELRVPAGLPLIEADLWPSDSAKAFSQSFCSPNFVGFHSRRLDGAARWFRPPRLPRRIFVLLCMRHLR